MNIKKLVVTLIQLLISILSINSYSLWTDEGIRLHAIVFGNFKEVIHYGLKDKQLFFVLKQYFWTYIFGTTEFATRSLNLVFVCVIIYYLNLILKKRGISTSYGLLLFISPMFVYYMNDAGPYIMLLAYSFAFLYYVFFTESFNSKKNTFMINVIFFLGVGTHFIFGFVYVMYLVKIIFQICQKQLKFKVHFFVGLVFSPLYICILFFYLQAIESGANRGWDPPTLLNLLFVIYSFLGLAGLSLPRNEIRAGNFETIQLFQIILPSLLACAMFILSAIALKFRKIVLKPHFMMIIATLLYGLVFYLFSYKWHFHFWDRHFIMAYAVFMILLIEVCEKLIEKRITKLLIIVIGSLFLISSLQLRFNPYYGKDNYKEAIAYVLKSKKSVILYQGDWKVSNYYGVEALSFKDYQNKKTRYNAQSLRYVVDIRNKSAFEIDKIISNYPEKNILVVFNEKYDSKNAVKKYENKKNYKQHSYNTFSIYENR